MIEVKVVEDSINDRGQRLATLQVKFHRFILPEFNTHRVFSRNFSSSRAIPTKKLLEQVRRDPATPVHWGKNQPGMQAHEELEGMGRRFAEEAWKRAAESAAMMAEEMAAVGVHKQIVNRIIEPYLWANGIVSSTEWDNWFELRDHEDAQPEIKQLASEMKQAMQRSTPRFLKPGEWHLPYVLEHERADSYFKNKIDLLKKISAARCCRVSYLKHDGTVPVIDDDIALFERLAGSVPIHASPLEHQATPNHLKPGALDYNSTLEGNLKGWVQFRKLWEASIYNVSK